jgi:hypothetical protein
VIRVGERRALVIASQCEGLNLLSFLPDAASDVASALLDPAVGGCVPALPERPFLVDPTVDQLDDAITEAFARASEDEATLFLALVGHGEYTADDFYFLTKDTKLPPSSRTAFMLAQRVRELLGEHSMLDGLVLLLDTCHAGIAAQQAAGRWISIVSQAGRRFEVLTASDERTAANGCFSRKLVQVLRSGHPKLGERLRCPDMKTVLSSLCPMQTAVHLAFDGRRVIEAGDEGLWLAMNSSEVWRGSAAADNPAAAEIDRLTRDYEPPHQLASVVSLAQRTQLYRRERPGGLWEVAACRGFGSSFGRRASRATEADGRRTFLVRHGYRCADRSRTGSPAWQDCARVHWFRCRVPGFR